MFGIIHEGAQAKVTGKKPNAFFSIKTRKATEPNFQGSQLLFSALAPIIRDLESQEVTVIFWTEDEDDQGEEEDVWINLNAVSIKGKSLASMYLSFPVE